LALQLKTNIKVDETLQRKRLLNNYKYLCNVEQQNESYYKNNKQQF